MAVAVAVALVVPCQCVGADGADAHQYTVVVLQVRVSYYGIRIPSEFSDVSDCMSGSEFLTGTYDWAIQFSQSPTVPGTVGTYPLTVWEKSLGLQYLKVDLSILRYAK